MGQSSIVAAGHPKTTEAAAWALANGGNAYDAAVAGWLASCLAEPVLTSPGGGGFAMVSPAAGAVRLYDFFVQTPKSHNPGASLFPLEADFGSTRQVFHLGAGSMATPGCVAGVLQLHQDLGKLPLAECAAPARDFCREGIPVTAHAAKLFQVVSSLYTATEASRALFSSKEDPRVCLKEGEVFANPDFEGFLEMLISEGSRWFYEGDVGRLTEAFCQAEGGHLSRRDFQDYTVVLRDPLLLKRSGATIWLNPPPSMGGTLIGIGLSLRDPSPLPPYPFHQTSDWNGWIEPLRIMEGIRSPENFARLEAREKDLIEMAWKAHPTLRAALSELLPYVPRHTRTQGTTHISVMDREGNEISMTTTNGAGSAVIIPGTGFMMNNMLGEEDLQPHGLETWERDIRLSSMMAPTLASLPDKRRVALGSGGSNRIRSTILQILRHLMDQGTSLTEAVLAPRLHWENNDLHAEPGAAEALQTLRQEIGWPVIEHEIPNLYFGGAHAVARSIEGRFEGIGDPRRGGTCLTT